MRGLLCALGQLPKRHWWGAGIGALAFVILSRRRRIALINIRLSFPELSAGEHRRLLRAHFRALGIWLANSLWALTASREQLQSFVQIKGETESLNQPCILLTPHFLGMDICLQALCLRYAEPNVNSGREFFYYYKPQHDSFWDSIISELRSRFGAQGLSTTFKHSLLHGAKRLRGGHYVCYLPDIDPGRRKSTVFVPFLGMAQTATVTTASHLSTAGKAAVIPIIPMQNEDGSYVVEILPPLTMTSPEADATAINATIGNWAQQQPQNYYWLHRRYKTPPAGARPPY